MDERFEKAVEAALQAALPYLQADEGSCLHGELAEELQAERDALQARMDEALKTRPGFVMYQIATEHCAAVDAFLALLREQVKMK